MTSGWQPPDRGGWEQPFRRSDERRNYTLGLSPLYTTFKTWTLKPTEILAVVGNLIITRPGSNVRELLIQLTANYGGANAAPSSTPSFSSNGASPVIQIDWTAGPGADEVSLRMRDSLGSTADVIFEYLEIRKLVP